VIVSDVDPAVRADEHRLSVTPDEISLYADCYIRFEKMSGEAVVSEMVEFLHSLIQTSYPVGVVSRTG
jgi:hypothetical protein